MLPTLWLSLTQWPASARLWGWSSVPGTRPAAPWARGPGPLSGVASHLFELCDYDDDFVGVGSA